MTTEDVPHLSRAGALRRNFDRSFAEPAHNHVEEAESFLALRVGGDSYALRLADISGLHAGRTIVALPTAVPGFLGVAGLRGSVVPVWSLAALLGYGAADEAPRWLVLVGDGAVGQALGLAFERFDGHLRILRADLSSRPGDGGRLQVRESIRVAGALRGVIGVGSITDAIRQRLSREGPADRTKDA